MLALGNSQDASPIQRTIALSRNSVWQRVYRVPYILPAGVESVITFADSAGVVLLVSEGEVADQTITFTEFGDVIDSIPHGSNFAMSITYPDIGDPSPAEYGMVIRKEPRFTLLEPEDTGVPVILAADFSTATLLGPKWIIKNGAPQVFVNSGHSNAVGVPIGSSKGAMLFYAPMAGGDMSLNVAVRNPGSGKTTIVIASDYGMSSYLGVQLDSGANKVQMVTGSGPVTMTNQGSSVTNTVAGETDTYQIKFDSLADTLSVYKNNSGTALASFDDTSHVVPIGSDHGYWGANWQGSAFSSGIEIISMNAQDGI